MKDGKDHDIWFFILLALLIALMFLFTMASLGCKTSCPPCQPEIEIVTKPVPYPQPFPMPAPLPTLEFETPNLTASEITDNPGALIVALTHDLLVYADFEEQMKRNHAAMIEAREKIIEEQKRILDSLEEHQ